MRQKIIIKIKSGATRNIQSKKIVPNCQLPILLVEQTFAFCITDFYCAISFLEMFVYLGEQPVYFSG